MYIKFIYSYNLQDNLLSFILVTNIFHNFSEQKIVMLKAVNSEQLLNFSRNYFSIHVTIS